MKKLLLLLLSPLLTFSWNDYLFSQKYGSLLYSHSGIYVYVYAPDRGTYCVLVLTRKSAFEKPVKTLTETYTLPYKTPVREKITLLSSKTQKVTDLELGSTLFYKVLYCTRFNPPYKPLKLQKVNYALKILSFPYTVPSTTFVLQSQNKTVKSLSPLHTP